MQTQKARVRGVYKNHTPRYTPRSREYTTTTFERLRGVRGVLIDSRGYGPCYSSLRVLYEKYQLEKQGTRLGVPVHTPRTPQTPCEPTPPLGFMTRGVSKNNTPRTPRTPRVIFSESYATRTGQHQNINRKGLNPKNAIGENHEETQTNTGIKTR